MFGKLVYLKFKCCLIKSLVIGDNDSINFDFIYNFILFISLLILKICKFFIFFIKIDYLEIKI